MLQVVNIVMVDRHVVRKALRGTSAVWKCKQYVCWSHFAYFQVLGFKDGPGLRVLVLAACCFLAYAASCLACKVFA